jgi:hypothetical protein
MARLYDLTADFLKLKELAQDPDVDPEVLADTMEGLDYEIEVKADNYAKIIRELTADSEAYKAEIDRFTARKKTVDNNIARLKKSLEAAMIATNKRKFKTELFSFNIQKNQASVVIDDESKIPAEYLIEQDPKIDKTKLKEDLNNGVDLQGVAHLEQSESIRIR